MRITGLEELQRQLTELQQRAENLSGSRELPISQLLTSEFMLMNTDFESADQMFKASGFSVETQQEFEAIPSSSWDDFVAARTRFSTWDALLAAAAEQYYARELMGSE